MYVQCAINKPGTRGPAQGAGQRAQGAGPLAQGAGPPAQGAGPLAQGAGPHSAQGAGPPAQGTGPLAPGVRPLAPTTIPQLDGAEPVDFGSELKRQSAHEAVKRVMQLYEAVQLIIDYDKMYQINKSRGEIQTKA